MLAVCYLRAMLRLGSTMEAVPIRREGSYHATGISADTPSASALRGAIQRGDWQGAKAAMPEEAWRILCNAAAEKRLILPDALDQALLYRLRGMSPDEWT